MFNCIIQVISCSISKVTFHSLLRLGDASIQGYLKNAGPWSLAPGLLYCPIGFLVSELLMRSQVEKYL